jgi:hypothetical protein
VSLPTPTQWLLLIRLSRPRGPRTKRHLSSLGGKGRGCDHGPAEATYARRLKAGVGTLLAAAMADSGISKAPILKNPELLGAVARLACGHEPFLMLNMLTDLNDHI